MRLHCASALLLALLLSAGSNATAQGSTCTAQLAAAAPSATTKFIDPNTPSSACTLPLCTGNNFASCNPPAAGAQRNLQLVFSDEFNQAGRPLGVEANDTRWTADNLWYAGTDDMEVYRSEQVTTAGGAAVITMEKGAASGPVQRDNGTVWNVTKDYKSSFFSSWNKSCGRHSGSWATWAGLAICPPLAASGPIPTPAAAAATLVWTCLGPTSLRGSPPALTPQALTAPCTA